jgi:hypothetical protein
VREFAEASVADVHEAASGQLGAALGDVKEAFVAVGAAVAAGEYMIRRTLNG